MTSSKANRTANPDLPNWRGVFPAVTTQFHQDNSVDIAGTNAVIGGLIRDGVHGLVLMGTVGENNSLSAQEKRAILSAAVKVVDKRVPIITGVSELTTSAAAEFAKNAEELGVDGLMVLPAMVYTPTEAELETHFKTVAKATSLPIMLYAIWYKTLFGTGRSVRLMAYLGLAYVLGVFIAGAFSQKLGLDTDANIFMKGLIFALLLLGVFFSIRRGSD